MTTAQDQQSRADFEGWARRACYEVERHDSGQYASNTTEQVWQSWQAACALPAGMEPVGEVVLFGNDKEVSWRKGKLPPAGAKLYTAAQVQAMGRVAPGWHVVPAELTTEMIQAGGHVNSEWLNDNAPIGEKRYALPMKGVYEAMLAAAPRPPAAQADIGIPTSKENQQVAAQVDCIGLALELERQALRVESLSVERAMAAAAHALRLLATTGPQAPTTGAGSATAGATQKPTQLTGAEMIHALEWRDQQWALHRSRIGLKCSCCKDGKYRSDGNGYSTFLRCDKCLRVPMWNEAGNEVGPHIN